MDNPSKQLKINDIDEKGLIGGCNGFLSNLALTHGIIWQIPEIFIGWEWADEFTSPFHVAIDGYGDLGERFVDVNGKGRSDLAYNRSVDSTLIER